MPAPSDRSSDVFRLARFVARVASKTAAILIVPILITVVYVHFLREVGELLPASAIAAMSTSAERVVWLTGYYDTGFLHKTDVARVIAPRVAVIGSSRVMQVRAQFFDRLPRGAFYNLGGCCRSMEESYRTVHTLLASRRRPDVILLGIEPWWFESSTERSPGPISAVVLPTAGGFVPLVRDRVSRILDRIQVLQLAWHDPRFVAAARQHFAPVRDSQLQARFVGISARVNRAGFRNDGSFKYGRWFENDEPQPSDSASAHRRDSAFVQATIADIKNRGTRGRYLIDADTAMLGALVAEAQAAGTKLIVFNPPVAPAAFDYFNSVSDMHEYLPRFEAAYRALCVARHVACVDLFDASSIGDTNADFYDWGHPSERLMAKIVAHMYDDPAAGPLLRAYGDPQRIATDLASSTRRWQLYDF